MSKITVIGTGSVGATIAYTLTVEGLASEILMIDINGERALGEALDISQGTPFCHSCSVYAGDYKDAVGSDIVIIASGVARKPDQTRIDLAKTNVEIIKSIIPMITKYAPDAKYIMVSNPVDILTYTFCKYSNIPACNVIGSGTVIDTSRLRTNLAEHYSINQQNVHGYVLGEHGDSSFVPWSLVNISNIHIDDYDACLEDDDHPGTPLVKSEVEEYVKKAGANVIKRKGATFYAVSVSVCHIVKCLLSGVDSTLTVSTMLNGEYGISDVCLSILNVVGKKGAHSKLLLPLTEEETAKLRASADSLKSVIKALGI